MIVIIFVTMVVTRVIMIIAIIMEIMVAITMILIIVIIKYENHLFKVNYSMSEKVLFIQKIL